ncbi:MAG: dihydroorotase [Clostridia bacterium]|nr:dihydroorotase [Clostridia bacterium]MDY4083019.1 dihydroorotase [Eubacteriales bacterium]
MGLCIKNANVLGKRADVLIESDRIVAIGQIDEFTEGCKVIQADGLTLLPAFVDMHTHLREPGFEAKETIATGSMAAVAGGYASVCCMPNTKPVTDNPYIVKYIIDRAREADKARVYPIGAISVGLKGETMAEMGKMKSAGAVAMSDDGQPVTTAQMMRLALEYAKDFNLLLISHCEDKGLVNEGVMNEGYNSTRLGLKGIPSAAEDVMIAREIILAEMLDTRVHIAHVSTASGVQLIREAKARGVKVTAETCPHYIAGTDDLVEGYDTMAKVNPPLREEKDRQAVIAGLADGTIDCIATDHAPHTKEDKNCEFNFAANGISGIETAFALCYTYLVDSGIMSLDKLSMLMTKTPAEIVGIPYGQIEVGGLADLTLVDLDAKYTIDSSKFYSKGKNTPFNGFVVKGKVKYTVVGGKIKYQSEDVR